MWNLVKGYLPKMGLGVQKGELLCGATWHPLQEEASISGPNKERCTLCLLQAISYPRTSGSPGDHGSGFFKFPASLNLSQGLASGTCTDEEDGPRGRQDPCWFPHTGFEILCDEGLLAGSPPVIVLIGLLCPRLPHLGWDLRLPPVASTSLSFTELHWAVISVNSWYHC